MPGFLSTPKEIHEAISLLRQTAREVYEIKTLAGIKYPREETNWEVLSNEEKLIIKVADNATKNIEEATTLLRDMRDKWPD